MGFEEELKKHAINAYAVKNEVNQRITEKAIQNPNASKREAEMMEHLIFEQLNYVRIKDAVAVCKDLCIPKEKLAELLKNRPHYAIIPDHENEWIDKNGVSYTNEDVEQVFRELEGLLKKGDTKNVW